MRQNIGRVSERRTESACRRRAPAKLASTVAAAYNEFPVWLLYLRLASYLQALLKGQFASCVFHGYPGTDSTGYRSPFPWVSGHPPLWGHQRGSPDVPCLNWRL